LKLISSREFNQDVSHAKREALSGPVFITDRGRPTHVLMSVDAFRAMTGQTESIVDLLAAPGLPDLDLERGVRGAWDRSGGID
jgi:PHD/YefM family antitoxin component YafN of YafNO toxin-antitoxin module